MACPVHDYGVVTQLEGVDETMAQAWARGGITNIRTLREALSRNLPIEGMTDELRASVLRQLADSEQRAIASNTTRHLEPRAGAQERGLVEGGGGGGEVGPPRGPGDDGFDPEGTGPSMQRIPFVSELMERIGRFGPNAEWRAMTSPMPGVRRMFNDLMTTSFRLIEDGTAPQRPSVNAEIKGWHMRGNRSAEQAHNAYLRYLLGMRPGERLTDRATVLKALTEEAKATVGRSERIARHTFFELVTVANNRGGRLGTLTDTVAGGRLEAQSGTRPSVFDTVIDEPLRDAVEDAARHMQQFYVDTFMRRQQVGLESSLDPRSYAPRLWDFDKVHGNEARIREELLHDILGKAKRLFDEGKLEPADLVQLRAYIEETLPRYIDAISNTSFMRLPEDFAEFTVSANRSKRERTFGKIVLGEGDGATILQPDFDTIAPYLHLDAMELLQRYLHTQVVDMELHARFGSVDGEARISQIGEAYKKRLERARERGAPKEEIASITARAEADVGDMRALIAAMRNTDRLPSHPYSVRGVAERAGEALRSYNYMRIGGGMAIPSLGDMSAMAMEHGVRRTMMSVYRELADDWQNIARMHSDADFSFMEITFSDIGRQLARNLFDASGYPHFGSSRVEKMLREGSNVMSTVNLLRPWTNIAKQAAAREITDHIVEVGEKLAKGVDARAELELFRAAGLDEADIRAVHELWKQHGGRRDGYTWLGLEKWGTSNNALMRKYQDALIRDVERLVVTPGVGDVPFLMRTGVGATILQFRKFGFSHTNRVLIPALQALAAGDVQVLHGMGLSLGIGATVYMLKELTNKREVPTDPLRILQESIVRSDLWGIVGEADGLTGAFTGGVVSVRGFIAPETFYGNRYLTTDLGSTILGPSVDTVGELGRTIRAGASVTPFFDSTDRDIRAIRKVQPFQNLFYADWLADVVENGLVGATQLMDPNKRDRQMEAVR